MRHIGKKVGFGQGGLFGFFFSPSEFLIQAAGLGHIHTDDNIPVADYNRTPFNYPIPAVFTSHQNLKRNNQSFVLFRLPYPFFPGSKNPLSQFNIRVRFSIPGCKVRYIFSGPPEQFNETMI